MTSSAIPGRVVAEHGRPAARRASAGRSGRGPLCSCPLRSGRAGRTVRRGKIPGRARSRPGTCRSDASLRTSRMTTSEDIGKSYSESAAASGRFGESLKQGVRGQGNAVTNFWVTDFQTRFENDQLCLISLFPKGIKQSSGSPLRGTLGNEDAKQSSFIWMAGRGGLRAAGGTILLRAPFI